MTNLEVLRQELKEFIYKASEADLMEVVLDSGREICDCCAYNYMLCGQECIHGFIAWGQQEYKEPEDEIALYVCGGDCEDKLFKLLENLQSLTSVSASLNPAERKNIGRLSKLSMSWSTRRF